MRIPLAPPALILALLVAGPVQSQTPEPARLVPGHRFFDVRNLDLTPLPAPPAAGTLAAQADLETILQLQAWRTAEEVAWARKTDRLNYFDVAEVVGPWFTPTHLPVCAKLLQEALGDGESANHAAKLQYRRLRPPIQDPRVQPCVTPPQAQKGGVLDPGYFSYPSGHATAVFITAHVLADLMPARRDALFTWARKNAWGRMLAGVHFPSDNLGGQILARIVHDAFLKNPDYARALEACRAELQAKAPAGGQ